MGNLREFTLKTEKTGAYNITRTVTDAIKESGVEDGMAVIFCPHTTAALTFNENTNPNVPNDLLKNMERVFPQDQSELHAHIKSSNLGAELIVFIDGGWPLLGVWQNIYFVEFDGPRERKFYIKTIAD